MDTYNINDPEDRLTMAVLELLDYNKEHVPLTPTNVEVYRRGSARYIEKIEKAFLNYYEKADDDMEYKGKVADMIDAITKGVRTLIDDVYKETAKNPKINRNAFKL